MENFLNDNQVKELETKDWVVKPKGFYLTLYREDYSEIGWNEICKVVGCSTERSEVKVLSFGYNN